MTDPYISPTSHVVKEHATRGFGSAILGAVSCLFVMSALAAYLMWIFHADLAMIKWARLTVAVVGLSGAAGALLSLVRNLKWYWALALGPIVGSLVALAFFFTADQVGLL